MANDDYKLLHVKTAWDENSQDIKKVVKMRFAVQKEELVDSLKKHKYMADIKNNYSILSTVKMEVGDKSLKINSASSTIDGIITNHAVKTENTGEFCVMLDKLFEIIKKAPAGCEIVFSLFNNNTCAINTGKIKYNIIILPTADFPDIGFDAKDLNYTLPIDRVRDSLIFVSNDNSQYTLNGVLFSPTRIASIDGRRCYIYNLEKEVPGFGNFTIPAGILHAIVQNEEGIASVLTSERAVKISVDKTEYYSEIIEGNFPNIDMFVPKTPTEQCTFRVSDVLKAMDGISPMIDKESNKVVFNFSKESVKIIAHNSDYGGAETIIDCDSNMSTALGFNYKLFPGVLKVLNNDIVTLQKKEGTSPIMFNNGAVTTVIMPMTLD